MRPRNLGVEWSVLESLEHKSDHIIELKLAEQILFKRLGALFNVSSLADSNNPQPQLDPMSENRHILALVMALATVIKVVMSLRTSQLPWEKLLEKCPTFLTSLKSTMLTKMKPKV